MRLAGKVAVVTGGSSGIGRAGCLRFAREGAKVAVCDINDRGGQEAVALIIQAGGEARYWHCDVSRTDEVQALMRGVRDSFGAVHVLFNNAAYLTDLKTVTDTSEDEWDRAIGTTLTGVFLCSKYAIPHIVAAGGGSIISTASVGGLVTFKAHAAYCTAKAGVIMLMKTIAADYGEKGVRANAIAPGAIDTPVNERYKSDPEAMKRLLGMSLVGRALGDPDEVASAAVFLASDESRFVTGTVLTVDGGWTAM